MPADRKNLRRRIRELEAEVERLRAKSIPTQPVSLPAPPRPKLGRPGRGVVAPDGRMFASQTEAARAEGLTQEAISYRARTGSRGWRFADASP